MDNEEINIEIKNPTLCIICLEELEELDNNIKKICVNCNIKCHKNCLQKWHRSKKKPVCPICLKTKKYYKRVNLLEQNNSINEEINEENNIDEEINIDDENNSIDDENYSTDEEDNREEELINDYLNRREGGIYYSCYFLRDMCITKRYVMYFFLFILGLYTYEIMD